MSDKTKPGMQKVRIGVLLDVNGNWYTSGSKYKDGNMTHGVYSDSQLVSDALQDCRSKLVARFFVIEVELPYIPQTIRLGEISNPEPVPIINIKDFTLPGELNLEGEK